LEGKEGKGRAEEEREGWGREALPKQKFTTTPLPQSLQRADTPQL